MPIYEYRCKACGEKFDKLVRMSTKTEEIVCPKCGQRQAEKSVSLFGAIGDSVSSGAGLAGASCGPST
ncbi:MAG: zinc ribbon domain-containing protein [Thermoflexales bacterium]|nr:zinc ribbon domain-containing protein [Thermoflexales bacterium]